MTLPFPPKTVPDRYEGLADAAAFGRLASRPNVIDPNAVTFFNAWVVGGVDIDPTTSAVVLKPQFTPIGSRPIAATSFGVPGDLGITKTGGEGQKGPVGKTLPLLVEVSVTLVKLTFPSPAVGVAVVFRPKGLDATVGGQPTATLMTDKDGKAQIDWQLGIIAGTQELDVAVAGATVTFKAEAK